MSTPIRTFLLTGLLFLGLATGAQAQDKYEFATVNQIGIHELKISIEGRPLENLSLGKELKDYADHSKLFAYVSKMQNEGWEVFNVWAEGGSMTFILRRKKA
jgi:hypothetical protein